MKPLRWIENGIGRLKVGTRLLLGFGLMLVFILVVAGTGVAGMHRLAGSVETIVVFNNAKLGLAQTLGRALAEQEKALLQLALASSAQEKDRAKAGVSYQAGNYSDSKKGLDEMFVLAKPDSFEEGVLTKLQAHEAKVPALIAKALKLDADEDAEGSLKVLREEVLPALAAWVTDLDELVSIEQRLNDAAASAAAKEYELLRYVSLGCLGVAIVLGVLVAFAISRGLLREMGGEPRLAAWVAGEIANGNLDVEVPVRAGTEGSLMAALKGTVEQLSPVLLAINQATETINTAATEIAAGNLDLSKRTEEQAASLEETAASMEELTATVQQNAENAGQANRLAAGASEVAVKGGQAVGQVVATMNSINSASKKIVDIISVIDSIAFQTNILALNAAVEAARAGEQGRGFAVVAGEVRLLAQRSADAAKEIKSLITESVERVADGTRLVDGAGATMDEIVGAVGRVTEIMAEISGASQQQYSGISQVNTAIAQMDEATQRNAALVEQATAAAESMREQAGKLVQAVAAFKLRAA